MRSCDRIWSAFVQRVSYGVGDSSPLVAGGGGGGGGGGGDGGQAAIRNGSKIQSPLCRRETIRRADVMPIAIDLGV